MTIANFPALRRVVLSLGLLLSSGAVAQQQFTCTLADNRSVSRIIGGSDAKAGDWPWQVAVLNGGLCGGSIIHPQWILTAAHCVVGDDGHVRPPDAFRIVSGSLRFRGNDGQISAVSAVFPHPDYQRRSKAWTNDIALLKLSRPLTVNRRAIVQLASAGLERAFARSGACAVVTGWGLTTPQQRAISETLRQVDVPLVDLATCRRAYSENRIFEHNLCAGYPEGARDSCNGDSGGPLVVSGGPKGWTQVGIVSWGKGCAEENAYGVYTRVAPYIGWIQQTVKSN